MTVRTVFCLFVFVWLGGCYVPIGSGAKQASVTPGRSSSASSSARTKSVDASTSNEHRLTIRGEVIRAGDFWRAHQKELLAQAKAVPGDEFRNLVANRAFRWMNDKMASALLFHKASLRISPDAEKRIDQYVDSDIRRVVTTEYDGVQRRYERHLESEGTTLEEERGRRRREIIVGSYLETEIKPKIVSPTRAELMAAFEANRDAWRKPSRRRMSLIDVRLTNLLGENVTTPSREEQRVAKENARSIIQTAQSELASGVAFADVARRHSHGLHAVDGGSWGWVSPDGVRERFKPAVDELYRLQEGRVSDPIETPDGFLLVSCDEIDPGFKPTFEAVQPELQERHFRNAYNRKVDELVDQLRRDAGISSLVLERFHAHTVDATLSMAFAASSQGGQ
ncbi:MAG: peptidyl-prolyl cis-trans isomerase [Planctomycetes bacterium]|nr:peptidyl-prolyl cis-trans isomerase [Planctomycetota bacterium]